MLPQRRSIRLAGHDYRDPGAYFITICTYRRALLFGTVTNDRAVLTPAGNIIEICWRAISDHFGWIVVDAFVVMPNHIHGILRQSGIRRGTACRAPTGGFGRPVPGSIPTVVRSFKSAATRAVNLSRGTPGFTFWQRGFYDHVIRDDEELNRLRRYIEENPLRWALDEENLDRPPSPAPLTADAA